MFGKCKFWMTRAILGLGDSNGGRARVSGTGLHWSHKKGTNEPQGSESARDTLIGHFTEFGEHCSLLASTGSESEPNPIGVSRVLCAVCGTVCAMCAQSLCLLSFAHLRSSLLLFPTFSTKL